MVTNKAEGPRIDPSPAFREAINQLADEAREQDRAAEEKARQPKRHRHFSKIVLGGLVLIVTQVGLLAYLLHSAKETTIPVRRGNEHPVLPANNCAAVVNRTYWRIVAYTKEKGHPPAKLEDLLGKYLDAMPSDPVSGKTLEYSVDGERFLVRCPGTAK